MKRRKFLKTAGAAGAAAGGAGVFSILKHPRNAQAAWGQWPEERSDLLIPEDLRVDKVLEVHFLGGVSAWETFYCQPDWGQAPQSFLHLFEGDAQNTDPVNAFDACLLGADGTPYTAPFANDSLGQEIHMGPWTAPFRNRPDIMDRMRVMVQYHGNLAHEGANPMAITGNALGRPKLAGIGAHIQRYFLEQPGNEGRTVPYSYLLFPTGAGFQPTHAQSATAIGLHPGSARPLSVQIQPGSDLSNLLARPGIPDGMNAEFDAAVSYYANAYGRRLRPGGIGAAARSAERGNYDFANFSRQNAPELVDLLSDDLFMARTGTACAGGALQEENETDMPTMQAEVARQLLTNSLTPARYVQWIDVGTRPRPEVGYDVHNDHVEYTSLNVPHSFQQIADIIATPDQDAEAEGLLDLDNTLIVLNMEFGRTPHRQGNGGSGTNHWPYGYATVMIGGPTRPGHSNSPGSSIYGYISETGEGRNIINPNTTGPGYSQEFITVAENRMMVLAAMGIHPFTSQSFAVADVRNADTEEACAERLRDVYWGVSV